MTLNSFQFSLQSKEIIPKRCMSVTDYITAFWVILPLILFSIFVFYLDFFKEECAKYDIAIYTYYFTLKLKWARLPIDYRKWRSIQAFVNSFNHLPWVISCHVKMLRIGRKIPKQKLQFFTFSVWYSTKILVLWIIVLLESYSNIKHLIWRIFSRIE